MTTAIDGEMLAALEQWARVRGWLHTGHSPPTATANFVSVSPRSVFLFGHSGRDVAPAVALAWAILVESDPPPVDVGPCPDCRERGGQMEWAQAVSTRSRSTAMHQLGALINQPEWQQWTVRTFGPSGQGHTTVIDQEWTAVATRPCPACSGTGRNLAPVPRLLLDATTDATARDALLVIADQLLADGHPAGHALAWGLRWSAGDGERDGTGEAVMLLHWLRTARQQAEQREDEAEDQRRLDEAFDRERERQRRLARGFTAQRGH